MKKWYYLFRLTLLVGVAMTTGATALHAQGEKITFTTAKVVGKSIELRISAAAVDQAGVWIDLDNDGEKDAGEEVTTFDDYLDYTIVVQTLTLYGKVTSLNCSSNQLQTLDVSQNSALTTLYCATNQLQSLNLSQNPALTRLWCFNNQLQSLDVSQNTALTELVCYDNQLQSLDVSQNTALTYLNCSSNQLESLNVANGNSANFQYPWGSGGSAVDITDNPALTCVQVDAGFDPTVLTGTKEWEKDATAQWNNDASKPCGSQTATSIALVPATTELGKGFSKQLSVRVVPFDAAQPALTWSSSDAAIATVDANGKVTGVAKGTATITATAGSLTTTCDITVYDPNDYQITFTTAKAVGSSIELLINAAADNQAGIWIDLNNNQIKDAGEEVIGFNRYTNYTIAAQRLTLYGKITGLNCPSNQLQTLDVSQNPALTYLRCFSNQLQSLNLANGNNRNFEFPGDFNNPAVDITSNSSLTCVQVDAGFDPTGLTGKKEWKKDAAAQWNNDLTNPCVAVTGVTLSETSKELKFNEEFTLTATVTPDNAANQNVSWSSSADAIATVDANGKVTAVGVGTATITVMTADGGFTASCAVTVKPVSVTGVSLPASKTLKINEAFTLTATVTPNNATNKKVIWSSSDAAIATVDNNGKVTSVAAGTATITATTADGGKTATCVVTVSKTAVAVTGVSLPASKTLKVSEVFTLTATVTPDNATNKKVIWSSDKPAIAIVDNNGKLTGVAAGTATITATTADGGKTATCVVTVTKTGTGVKDVNTSLITVYPNPSQGIFFVEVPSAGSLKIMNISGQEIHKHSLQAGKNKVEISQAGMYVVHISGKDYRTVRKVIVK